MALLATNSQSPSSKMIILIFGRLRIFVIDGFRMSPLPLSEVDVQHILHLQLPALSPVLEGDYLNAQVLRDLGNALAYGLSRSPTDISFDSLTLATHRSDPSSPLAEEVFIIKQQQSSWLGGQRI